MVKTARPQVRTSMRKS